ncbi:MAG TPA: hypothetical protein DEP66_03585 [Acidimicrobiaceae bacterium]|nr:hypothetical protein [Acidimicrobiaceae bacterium]HCB37295.1 hypothetical protein [Acidimicrobiaceae bacterium]
MADPRPLPAMVLTDTSGEPFDLVADTAGSVRLLFFGFTHCPDICNIQLAQLQQVLARPGAPANVDLLFVTVDPERDTPAVIRAYLDRFSTDFVGLVAEPDQLTRLANEVGAYAAVRQYDTGSTTPAHDHDAGAGHGHDGDGGAAGYEVGHDARVFAFAPDGVGYTQYPHPTRQSQYDHDLPLLAAIGARA